MNYFNQVIFLSGKKYKNLFWLTIFFLLAPFIDILGLAIFGPYISFLTNINDFSLSPYAKYFFYIGIDNFDDKFII